MPAMDDRYERDLSLRLLCHRKLLVVKRVRRRLDVMVRDDTKNLTYD